MISVSVPSDYLKSVCAKSFFCATFYLTSSEFGLTCMKYMEKNIFEGNIYVRSQVFLCVRSSHDLCASPLISVGYCIAPVTSRKAPDKKVWSVTNQHLFSKTYFTNASICLWQNYFKDELRNVSLNGMASASIPVG